MKLNSSESNPNKDNNGAKNITQRTLGGLFWLSSGSGVQAVLRLLVLIVLARLLTPEDFGLVGAAMVVVAFSTLFSQLGMGPAIIQRPNLEDRHLRSGFVCSIIFGILLGILIIITAPLIAGLFKIAGLTPVIRVIALLFPIQGLGVIANALIIRELRFRLLATIEILSYSIGYGIIGIILAVLGFGVWALVGAHLARAIVKAAISLYAQPHPKRPQFERLAFQELMFFGGGFTLAKFLNYTAHQGDNIVVGRWLGAEALGLYGRAYQLLVVPVNLMGSVLDRVLFPAMAKVQHDPHRLELAYRRGMALISLTFGPLSMVTLVIAPEIVLVLLGPEWIEVIAPFQILAVGMLFRASPKMDHSIARATGAVYKRAWRQGIYAAFVLGGAWIGQHWGVSGVAIGVLVALVVNFLLMVHLSLSLTSMTWKRFSTIYLSSLLVAVFTLMEVWAIATILRSFALPAIVVLVLSLALTGVILLVQFYFAPRLFLGADGIWMLQTLVRSVEGKRYRFDWAKRLIRKYEQ